MQNSDYKEAIRSRLKSRDPKASATLRRLATHLDLQYTYLCKILNSDDLHLKEDSVFDALTFLKFTAEERAALMDARILAGSQSRERKAEAAKRLAVYQAPTLPSVEEKKSDRDHLAEAEYLLDPLATLVFVALGIKRIQKDVGLLQSLLSLSRQELLAVLDKIEAAGLISRGEEPFEVKKLLSPRLHFRPDHVYMRLHQQQLRLLSLQRLARLNENRKKSFMVTFAADPPSVERIRDEFSKFIQQVEKIASSAKASNVYQLSFDLFDWL